MIKARVARTVGELAAGEWDALTGGNPFLSHAFLTTLEDSGSVGPGTGWAPAPLVIQDGEGRLAAALPA
ncbi:MAG TPA: peptidogalycan biosysnthesis protein, partial [Novosphingobium sp.]|nr:peptidogalycan biosysnthesis protein [Novosphingobium sp.]